jgi:hypothetical protein
VVVSIGMVLGGNDVLLVCSWVDVRTSVVVVSMGIFELLDGKNVLDGKDVLVVNCSSVVVSIGICVLLPRTVIGVLLDVRISGVVVSMTEVLEVIFCVVVVSFD